MHPIFVMKGKKGEMKNEYYQTAIFEKCGNDEVPFKD